VALLANSRSKWSDVHSVGSQSVDKKSIASLDAFCNLESALWVYVNALTLSVGWHQAFKTCAGCGQFLLKKIGRRKSRANGKSDNVNLRTCSVDEKSKQFCDMYIIFWCSVGAVFVNQFGFLAYFVRWPKMHPCHCTRKLFPCNRVHEFLDICWNSSSAPKLRLDWFNRFCRARGCAQHTKTHGPRNVRRV